MCGFARANRPDQPNSMGGDGGPRVVRGVGWVVEVGVKNQCCNGLWPIIKMPGGNCAKKPESVNILIIVIG